MNQRVGNVCPRSPKSVGGKREFSRRGGHSSGRRRKRKRRRKKNKTKKKNVGRGNDSSKVKNILRKTEEYFEVK